MRDVKLLSMAWMFMRHMDLATFDASVRWMRRHLAAKQAH